MNVCVLTYIYLVFLHVFVRNTLENEICSFQAYSEKKTYIFLLTLNLQSRKTAIFVLHARAEYTFQLKLYYLQFYVDCKCIKF
jgi:hypothetical protein